MRKTSIEACSCKTCRPSLGRKSFDGSAIEDDRLHSLVLRKDEDIFDQFQEELHQQIQRLQPIVVAFIIVLVVVVQQRVSKTLNPNAMCRTREKFQLIRLGNLDRQ